MNEYLQNSSFKDEEELLLNRGVQLRAISDPILVKKDPTDTSNYFEKDNPTVYIQKVEILPPDYNHPEEIKE